MKLVSFSAADGIVCPGILSEETSTVLDLSRRGFAGTLDVIKQGGLTMAGADKFPLDQVKLHAPLPNPPRIFAIGLNYRDHAKESNLPLPDKPIVFSKFSSAVIAPGEPNFGTSTIRDLIPYEFGGMVDLVLAAGGVRCRLELPADWLGDDGLPVSGAIADASMRTGEI